MKTVTLASCLYQIIKLMLPPESNTKGIHLRFYHDGASCAIFTHLLILRPKEEISIFQNWNTDDALKLSGTLAMRLVVSEVVEETLADTLSKFEMFPDQDLFSLDLIQDVSCNTEILPNKLGKIVSLTLTANRAELAP